MRKAEVERHSLCSKPRSQRGPGVAAPSWGAGGACGLVAAGKTLTPAKFPGALLLA